MTRDQKIDKILKAITSRHLFSHLYKTLINDTDSEATIDTLRAEMTSLELIKKEEYSNEQMDVVILDNQGLRTNEAGGWLRVKYDKLGNGQKIQKLLEFMVITSTPRFHWSSEDLGPAFEGALNKYEIEYLCKILIDDRSVVDAITKDGFGIGCNEHTKQVFYGKKYLTTSSNHQQTTNIDIGSIQNISGTVISGVKYNADSSVGKTETVLPPKEESSVVKKIIIGVIVSLIAAVILYYVFGIKA